MSSLSLPELIFRPEGPKFDIKQQLWNLDTSEGKAEFIKDVSAIANSPGQEIGYIILGITDADRSVVGIDRNLLNEERLQQIVAEYIDPPFALSFTMKSLLEHSVGLISVPPSSQKPHLINRDIGKLRQGTCYVRRGSITALARSSDLRMMIKEVISIPPDEDTVSEKKWGRGDIERLDRLASAILWAFIKTGKTELSLREIEDHCSDELEGKERTGKVLAGKLKTFYSRYGKDKLVEKNTRTGRWRFDDSYRSCAASVLREKGFI
jgi:predicted HTH transcriptional regulator